MVTRHTPISVLRRVERELDVAGVDYPLSRETVRAIQEVTGTAKAPKPKPKVKGPRRTPATGASVTRVYITFGATADPIKDQLAAQGIAIPATSSAFRWQDYHDAITLLKIHQLIIKAEADKAYARLGRLIVREIARADKRKRAAAREKGERFFPLESLRGR